MGIFITGCSGVLGKEVMRQLAKLDIPMTIGARSIPKNNSYPWQYFDLDNDQSPLTFNDCKTILHLASNVQPNADSDLKGIKRLLAIAQKEKVKKIIYISIVGVGTVPLKYFKTKKKVEVLIQNSDLPFSILRATQFHEFFEQEVQKHIEKPLIIIPDLYYQPIETKIVAKELIKCCIEAPTNSILEIGGPEILSYKKCIQHYLKTKIKKSIVISIPNFLLGKLGSALTTKNKIAESSTWYKYLQNKK